MNEDSILQHLTDILAACGYEVFGDEDGLLVSDGGEQSVRIILESSVAKR